MSEQFLVLIMDFKLSECLQIPNVLVVISNSNVVPRACRLKRIYINFFDYFHKNSVLNGKYSVY